MSNLIKYRDLDLTSLGQEVQFYLGLVRRKSLLKIFGTNEKGMIMLLPQYNGYGVHYIFVREEFRRQGVCKELIASALRYCKRYRKVLEMRIIFNSPVAEHIEQYALSLGMFMLADQRIFIVTRQQFEEAKGDEWINSRMMRVVQRFLANGYGISSFGSAPKGILDKLKFYFDKKNTPSWETPGDMHPFRHRYDSDKSFICWKDDQPVSYICVERYGDSIVSKEHFCFRKYFNLGVSIIPLCYMVTATFQDPGINRLSSMVLQDNTHAFLMLQREYSRFAATITVQKTYAGNAALPEPPPHEAHAGIN